MKNIQKKHLVLLSISQVLAVGCNRDPEYPSLQQEPPIKQQSVETPFTLGIPSIVEFVEGVETQVDLEARVPSPGRPIVEALNLPQGAVIDPSTNILKWKPGIKDGDNPNDILANYRTFSVDFVVRSSADPIRVGTKTVTFFVRNSNNDFVVELAPATSEYTFFEGEKVSIPFKVINPDFPEGPFSFQLFDLPEGSKVEKLKDNTYQLVFNPSYDFIPYPTTPDVVIDWSKKRAFRPFYGKIFVTSPRAEVSVSQTIDLKIVDKTVAPLFSGMKEYVQGKNGQFSFSVHSPSGPVDYFNLIKRPEVGIFETSVYGNEFFKTYVSTWKGIPKESLGGEELIRFRACTTGPVRVACSEYEVKVKLSLSADLTAEIDRTFWPRGDVRYLLSQTQISEVVECRDPANPSVRPLVEISGGLPGDSYSYSSPTLYFKGGKPGTRSVNLRVTGFSGDSVTETFLFDVLPTTWEKVLLVSEAIPNPESDALSKSFSSLKEIRWVDKTARELARRKALLVSTSILSSEKERKEFESESNLFKNIIVSGRGLLNFSDKLLKEIESYGIKLDLAIPVDPNLFVVGEAASGLASGKNTLLGTTTPLSGEVHSLVYSRQFCDLLMTYQLPDGTFVPAAVSCRRPNQGRLVITGFEISDLQDVTLSKKWFDEIVKGWGQ
jgi:hypothetical protein